MHSFIRQFMLLTAAAALVTSCSRETLTGTGAAKQEHRNFKEFSGLNVSGNYEILGTKGMPEKFVISSNANILPYIETWVKDAVLTVEDKKSVTLHPTVTQNIWFTIPKLESVTLNGSSVFQFPELDADKLTLNLSGSHHLLLTGKASEVDVTISGSSEVDARDLITDSAKVAINGSGTVYVNPSKALKITINGSGKVVYFSQAPKIEQNISGSGEVLSSFGGATKAVNSK